nr:hypothetical protein [Tanacetum cinerariifolium]
IHTTPITTDGPTITTFVIESNTLTVVALRVVKLDKDMSGLKTVDHSTEALALLNSQVPIVVEKKEYEKSPLDILKIKKEQVEKQQMPKFTIKSTNKAAFEEYDMKSALYQSMHANKSFNRNPSNHQLYQALMEALIEVENTMDKEVADTVKVHKRKHANADDDDDEGPLAGPNQGKQTKRRRIKESKTEGDSYPFDLSKPLPLQGLPCHQTISADYFFNNDLEYLNTSDPEVTYTTSIMKTKATRYKIKGIEDMVPTIWSTIKHAYDKDAEKGIKHWGERRDFVDLHLNDIEDMLLLAVQHKLFHLHISDIVDFIVALRIVYEDLNKQKRVLRADELYKFSDGTLKSVCDEIHHKVLDFRLDYNTEMPTRKCTAVGRRRSGLMIELIDKQP